MLTVTISNEKILVERGATMVEFALVLIIALGLIGATYDFGVLLFRHSILTHSMADMTRRAAAQVTGLSDCNEIENIVDAEFDRTNNALRSRFPPQARDNIEIEIRPSGNNWTVTRANCALVVRTTFPVNCFLCVIFPENLRQTTVASRQLIENHDWCTNQIDAKCAGGALGGTLAAGCNDNVICQPSRN